jgi:hypothetical protein
MIATLATNKKNSINEHTEILKRVVHSEIKLCIGVWSKLMGMSKLRDAHCIHKPRGIE